MDTSSLTISAPLHNSLSLLPTAQVIIIGAQGQQVRARTLLDQGSEMTFISESLVQYLRLIRQRAHVSVIGVGGSKNLTSRFSVSFRLKSVNDHSFEIDSFALVLSRPTGRLPSKAIPVSDWSSFTSIPWADPSFHSSGDIGLILGVDVYATALRHGLQRLSPHDIIAQNTAFGWVFSGRLRGVPPSQFEETPKIPRAALHCSIKEDSTDNLSEILKAFWSIEEVPASPHKLAPDDEICENIFTNTHTRTIVGQYVVRLPLKIEPPSIINKTRHLALNSFKPLTRKFDRDPEFAREYYKFMREYESLGHMSLIPENEISSSRAWYLPHHAVMHKSALKAKIRVVFDASRRTVDHQSLNSFLLPGPPLQSDLSLVLLGWRRFRYVFTADIVKMFRQIRVDKRDQDLQRILWSSIPGQAPRDYRLTTVTYGTASAPYLAMRTLIQLARDEGDRFPLGAMCILKQCYVDDIFSGAEQLEEAIQIRDQLIAILQTARIKLDKWAVNTIDLIPGDSSKGQIINTNKTKAMDQMVKTLGLLWNPASDSFGFNVEHMQLHETELTKQKILSCIARLFDPLGWLAPITVKGNIFLQDLWIQKVEWDALLPPETVKQWHIYCHCMSGVNAITINRWLGLGSTITCELHGFSDASKRAYAAAVYLRVTDDNGNHRVSLLIANSKLAPVKTITIPNLELCGVVLLIKLIKFIQQSENFRDLPVTAWCDSRDVLAWIRKHLSQWKVFVANRVSYIQTELPSAVWRYVPSAHNPADLATRGLSSDQLKESTLWWQGPDWLSRIPKYWPEQPKNSKPSNSCIQVFVSIDKSEEDPLITRFSSLSRLNRVVAYCLRFFNNTRKSKAHQSKDTGSLTTNELVCARLAILRLVQHAAFKHEIFALKGNLSLPKSSALYTLRPFIDDQGIIRVGGRLTHSALPFPAKHPPILPKLSNLSQLFIRQAHCLALHGGPTLTLGLLLQRVWVIGAIEMVKRHVHACNRCFRVRPRLSTQQMGNLPSSRVTPSRAFTISGLDYAGQFKLKFAKGRGQRAYKGYIALFVCFSTKAIHLDAVSDLTSQSFIAAFRRFSSRRGLCKQLYSDNGTNFQGADKELRAMFQISSDFYSGIATQLAEQGIDWKIIPPNSLHFGGLWEAGVKATKHHLLQVIGEHLLTFEEFSTVLCEIEACLNSRPLCPLTGDIDDLQALIPSLFLLGRPSTLVPEAPLTS